MLTESKNPLYSNQYPLHLARLVRACGETLMRHAAEIVGTKSGTTAFQIVITIPQDYDGCPTIETRQTYVSDETIRVRLDWPDAYKELPDLRSPEAAQKWIESMNAEGREGTPPEETPAPIGGLIGGYTPIVGAAGCPDEEQGDTGEPGEPGIPISAPVNADEVAASFMLLPYVVRAHLLQEFNLSPTGNGTKTHEECLPEYLSTLESQGRLNAFYERVVGELLAPAIIPRLFPHLRR